MNTKNLRLPTIIIALGIVAAILSSMLLGIVKEPTVTEHEFNYSVTYKLDGELVTFDGVYKCVFCPDNDVAALQGRYYIGEHLESGLALHPSAYTIAQKDGSDLCIEIIFNESYLMGDAKNDDYDSSVSEPSLVVYDREGIPCYDLEALSIFDAEIVSWEYPEPIENSFVFAGFSMLYELSMFVMIAIGIVVIILCLIFVKKDLDVTYTLLDKIGVALNYITAFVVFPTISLFSWLIQVFAAGPDWIYQGYLCAPVTVLFSLAASISLRRKGFKKSGFFVQLVGPVVYFALIIFEIIS